MFLNPFFATGKYHREILDLNDLHFFSGRWTSYKLSEIAPVDIFTEFFCSIIQLTSNSVVVLQFGPLQIICRIKASLGLIAFYPATILYQKGN